VSWKNPAADKVIKKVHKGKAKPLYGLFEVNKDVIEYQGDGELRDFENVALDPSRSVTASVEAYFIAEVQPHVADAWINASKRDAKDGEVGIVGYGNPLQPPLLPVPPPRPLEAIDADLDAVSAEIMSLLREVVMSNLTPTPKAPDFAEITQLIESAHQRALPGCQHRADQRTGR